MTVTTIIDQIIGRAYNAATSDADNATLRARVLEYLIEVAQDFILAYDWSWAYRRTTVTIAAAAKYASLPADFQDIGAYGGVYRSSDGKPLDYKTPSEIQALQEDPGQTTPTPDRYSIFDVNPVAAPDYQDRIQTAVLSAAVTLVVHYRTTLPTLDESAGLGAISAIPARYHQTVLIPGIRALVASSLGDGQALERDGKYQQLKRKAIQQDIRGRGQSFQLQSFFGDQ